MAKSQNQNKQVRGRIISRPITAIEPHRMYVVKLAPNADERLKQFLDNTLIMPSHINPANGNAVMQGMALSVTSAKPLEMEFAASELMELDMVYIGDAGQVVTVPLKFSQYPLATGLHIIDDGQEYFGEVEQIPSGFIATPDGLVAGTLELARIHRRQFHADIAN